MFVRAIIGAQNADLALIKRWLDSDSPDRLKIDRKIRHALAAKDTENDPINRKFKFKRDVANSWGLDLILDDKEREDALAKFERWTLLVQRNQELTTKVEQEIRRLAELKAAASKAQESKKETVATIEAKQAEAAECEKQLNRFKKSVLDNQLEMGVRLLVLCRACSGLCRMRCRGSKAKLID